MVVPDFYEHCPDADLYQALFVGASQSRVLSLAEHGERSALALDGPGLD
jgi:hypothetical protein